MGTRAAALAVACTVLGFLSAQDDLPRQRLFGIALRADRSPWVGARVHACAAGPWSFAVGEPDHVTALSDARGRFHVEVLGGRGYAVWAEQSLEDGTVLVSTDVREGWAGERVVLEAAATAVAAQELVLRELPNGIALPLHVVVRSAVTGLVEDFLVDALQDGAASRPLTSTPTGSREVIVSDAHGRLVLSAGGEDLNPLMLRPAPARWLRVRVRDAEKSTGIAGADILGVTGGRHFVLGSTDADGVAVFDAAPLGARVGNALIGTLGSIVLATAPGFGLGMLDQREAMSRPTREKALTDARPDLVVRLFKPANPPIRLRLRVGTAAFAGAHVLVRAGVAHDTDRGTVSSSSGIELSHVTDSSGVIELPGRSVPMRSPSGRQLRASVALVMDPHVLRQLPVTWRERLPVVQEFDLLESNATNWSELIDIDLASVMRPIDVHLVAPDGATPIAGVEVHCGPLNEPGRSTVRSDRVGRVRTLVPVRSEEPFVVATIGESGWCAHHLEPGAVPRDPNEVARVTAQLAPPLKVDVTVVPGRLPRLPEDLHVTCVQDSSDVWASGDAPDPSAPATEPILIPFDPRRQVFLLRAFAMCALASGDHVTIFVPSVQEQMTIHASGRLDGLLVTTSVKLTVAGDEGTIAFELAFDQ
ncbi:MAG: hypothetical protein HZB39_13660 [Planctomycetes bacterium]|nr:hypothetical protein [Planctomycetota bacterium]